ASRARTLSDSCAGSIVLGNTPDGSASGATALGSGVRGSGAAAGCSTPASAGCASAACGIAAACRTNAPSKQPAKLMLQPGVDAISLRLRGLAAVVQLRRATFRSIAVSQCFNSPLREMDHDPRGIGLR